MYPDTLKLRCPKCSRALRDAPLMQSATLVVKRTCKCGARWSLKISPARVNAARAIHVLDWTPEPGA